MANFQPGTVHTITLADGETCRVRVEYHCDPRYSHLAGEMITIVGVVDVNNDCILRLTLDELAEAADRADGPEERN